jgi:hypothetical protein
VDNKVDGGAIHRINEINEDLPCVGVKPDSENNTQFLWASDESWIRWCITENSIYVYREDDMYILVLNITELFLNIGNSLELFLSFLTEYEVYDKFEAHLGIDWVKVYERYPDGVSIDNCFWYGRHFINISEKRLQWLETWDCNSSVLISGSCIMKKIKLEPEISKSFYDMVYFKSTGSRYIDNDDIENDDGDI